MCFKKKEKLKYTSMEYSMDVYDSGDDVEDIDMGICVDCKETTMVAHLSASNKNLCRNCLEDG